MYRYKYQKYKSRYLNLKMKYYGGYKPTKILDNRIDIYNKCKKIFSEKINCDEIENFVNDNKEKKLAEGKEGIVYLLNMNDIKVAAKYVPYNGDPNYTYVPNGKISLEWMNYTNETYEFMKESNTSGFDFFPYVYQIINCPNKDNSYEYIFYEAFDGDLLNLLMEETNKYALYTIFFQLIRINYYLEIICGMKYFDGKAANHLFRKIKLPTEEKVVMDSYEFILKNQYLVVIWDFHNMKQFKEPKEFKRNFMLVMKNINQQQKFLSEELVTLINSVNENPTSTPQLLYSFYNNYMIGYDK